MIQDHPALAPSPECERGRSGAADRVLAVADADRLSSDAAVGSLDLIIVAWSRELADLGGDQCPDLPTLREVF